MEGITTRERTLLVLAFGALVFLAGCGGNANQGTSNQGPGNQATTSSPNPIPVIDGITQNCAQVGGQAFTLSVAGSNFVPSSVVRWNSSERPTNFVNGGQLSAEISANDIASAGTVAVDVFSPAPGGGSSNVLMLTIGTTGVSPQSVVVDPTGKFVYVTNAGCPDAFIGSVSIYTINLSTGALQPIGAVKVGTSTQSVAVDPSGSFVYVPNDEHRDLSSGWYSSISMYAVEATTGLLSSRGKINAAGRAVSMAVHSSGKFAYVTSGCSDGVSTYAVDTATGALTLTGTISTGATGPSDCSIRIAITIDPSGKFAYVTGDGCGLDEYPGYVSVYTINPTTGELTPVGQALGTGYCSAQVSVDPFSRFAYVPNSADDDISMYAIGASNGALTFLGTVAAASNPVSGAVHPSGKFAYVVNRDSNNISIYAIDSNTGILTSIGTIATGSSPNSIAIDPSGKFAYVTNADSDDISMYSIDANTGTLTLIGSRHMSASSRSAL